MLVTVEVLELLLILWKKAKGRVSDKAESVCFFQKDDHHPAN